MKNSVRIKKLKDLADVIPGASVLSSSRLKKGRWQLIRGRNIVGNTVLESDVFISENFARKVIKATIVPGDILLSTIFEQYKVGITPSTFPPAIADRGIVIIRPKLINKEYLHKFLTSKTGKSALVGQLAKMVRGSVIKFITTKDVSDLNVPILPKNLLEATQVTSNVASKINEMRKMFEIEIVRNVRKFLLEKGWKENQIVLEYPILEGLRADMVLTREGEPKILIEIKKDMRDTKSVQAQLQLMSKAAGIKESYLVTGEGIQKITENGEVTNVPDLPSPQK